MNLKENDFQHYLNAVLHRKQRYLGSLVRIGGFGSGGNIFLENC